MIVLRRSALLLTASLAFSTPFVLTSTAASPARSAPDGRGPDKAASAADWLAGELVHNRMPSSFQGATDWGLTIDTLFALTAEDPTSGRVPKIARVLARHVNDYTDFQGARSAGASAKLLVAAKVAGRDVRDFGGVDLRSRVLRLVGGRGAGFERGRLRDTGGTDFSNTIGQSFGVVGLSRTGGAPGSTVDFLLEQRCKAGWFRLLEESDEGCRAAQDEPDTDATAYALQAMVSARSHGTDLPSGAIRRTTRWLLSAQHDNGAFGGGSSTEAANANSTGLAAQALAALDHRRAAAKAAAWVADLQLTRGRVAGTPARDEVGTIGYDKAAVRSALRDGIAGGNAARDQWRRSTAQGIFAFVPKPLTVLRASAS